MVRMVQRSRQDAVVREASPALGNVWRAGGLRLAIRAAARLSSGASAVGHMAQNSYPFVLDRGCFGVQLKQEVAIPRG